MKLSENWLREWVDPSASTQEIADRLIMGGLELEIEPAVSEPATGVVVGRILKADKHPQADRLQVCSVDAGQGAPLQIVCGAPNARAGINVPCALVGAKLPGGLDITAAQLRGVESFGMLCSAKELALSEKSDGLLELDNEAKPGAPIEQYLDLQDNVLNLEITPNRGDCLSVLGLARDVAALYGVNMKRTNIPPAVVVGHEQLKVEISDLADCPTYCGRVISKLNPKARTPDWMRERLRRSGLRCIHPIVDISNYVMLELGQPLHAFDADTLKGSVRVRRAAEGETLKLLNEQVIECRHKELLIADDSGGIALAGVMGGFDSGVSETTTRIFLESASFAPAAIAGSGRRHKLHSDASYRFERGVDPGLQRLGMERATQLLSQICGGEVHPITQVGRGGAETTTIRLRHARLVQVLGHEISAREVESLLARLNITLRAEVGDSWMAKVPSYRCDLRLEVDLIEEVARLYGYDNIPAKPYLAALPPSRPLEAQRSVDRVKDHLVARGWQEVVTLAFVEPRVQHLLDPESRTIAVDNPIADTLAVMRSSLWAGMLPVWLHNRQRQHPRLRLFELGVCFTQDGDEAREVQRLAGLAVGNALPEQWGAAARPVDFYDLKADVVALLGATAGEYRFEAAEHPALHPGRCARITRHGATVGWMGQMHPMPVQALDLPEAPLLFELDWAAIRDTSVPRAKALSEFPSSRRDLAVVVAESVSAQALIDCVRAAGGKLLNQVLVFDIYRGSALGDACKSVALGLIFNDYSRTLTVEEIDVAVAEVTQALTQKLGATIRQ